ncbi:MAG: O-antigen polymerase, partial [Promethearchaeota archaeon]
MSITTVFYYPFYLLIDTVYNIILPLIFTSSFLLIPLFYSYKREIFKLGSVKKLILSNMMILTGLFTLIPVIVGINLLNLGLISDFNLFILNILNSSVYIFYAFLLVLIRLSKYLAVKEKYIMGLNRSHIITLFSISFTTIFLYPFLMLFGTFYGIILPLIALLFSWFFLFYYSYKREYFNLEKVKKLTIYNFTAISCLIISLPSVIGFDLARIGLKIDIILIITITVLLLFGFLKISEMISIKIKLKDIYVRRFKLLELISWFSFTLLLSYFIASIFMIEIDLTPITFLILSGSLLGFFLLSIYSLNLLSNYTPRLSYLAKLHDIIIYGILGSISSLFTFLGLSTNLFRFLIHAPILMQFSIILGFFLGIFLVFLIGVDKLIELKFIQVKIILELVAWLFIKILICTLIFSLIEFYLYQFFILNKIFLFSSVFTLLTPLSLLILKNFKYISSKNQFLMKKVTLIIFIISFLSLYLEIILNLTSSISIFYQNPLFQITTIIINSVLIVYNFILKFNKTAEEDSVIKMYTFYLLSVLLFICLLYYGSILSIFLILFSYSIVLSNRSSVPVFRFFTYFLMSFVTFIDIIVILSIYGVIVGFDIILLGLYITIYLSSMSAVLFFSVLLNIKRNNILEKYTLYSLISLLTFISLTTFTKILFIYNLTISLFLLLLFIGISFYVKEDERYKWFINPCVLLFIFDLFSFLSYSWFFNNPIFELYNPVLTFTLTLSMTGFGFILLYNKAPARFRQKSFLYIVLPSIVLSFPTFLYFLIIAALSLPIWSLVPFIVAINFGVFLFYLSIGIYQWRISWAIWKAGWYAWNIIPIANFFLIYPSLTGVDVATEALVLFGTYKINGSVIISLIICVLIWLPCWYTWIKKHFAKIILVVWGLNLFLLYWASQNLFPDLLLRNLSFIAFSATLLMPLLIIFKFWKIVSIFWVIVLTPINAVFLGFYFFTSIGFSLQISISIDILIIGLFLIVYSFFPNIRSVGVVLISAYFITLLGIFLTIYFILFSIIKNPIFSINISLIIIGFTLFSSKYMKIPKRIVDLILSWILIINFSWLTFNLLSLFPELVFLAFSLSLTVGGGT